MPPENETATEQPTETTEQPAVAPGGPASREDLIAAVAAAGLAPVIEEAPAATAPGETPGETKLERLFREREKAHAEREAARSYAEESRARADAEREKILADARAEADRIRSEDEQQRAARYRENPIEALRALGKDPQQIVDDVLRHGTPEAKALARAEEAERLAREATKRADGAAKGFEDWRAEQVRIEQEQRIAHAAQSFVSTLASPEAAPHLNARYDPQEIWEKSVAVMKDNVARGLRYNVDFDDGDVVAYLEKQSRERHAKLSPAAHQVSAAAPVTEPGNAPKVQANGPRTLSAAQGSERRTSPKPLHQLPPDQRRQALIDEVNAAMRANPKAEY